MGCNVRRGGGIKVLKLLGEVVDIGGCRMDFGLERLDEAGGGKRLAVWIGRVDDTKLSYQGHCVYTYLSAKPISSMGSSSMSTDALGGSGALSSAPAVAPAALVSGLPSVSLPGCVSWFAGADASRAAPAKTMDGRFGPAGEADDVGSVREAVRFGRQGFDRAPASLPAALPAAAASFGPAGAMNVSVKLENMVNWGCSFQKSTVI